MTGHPDSPALSPSGAGGEDNSSSNSHSHSSSQECAAAAAMHTMVTAQSPHQPLLYQLQNVGNTSEISNCIESEYALPVPMAPTATPVQVSSITLEPNETSTLRQETATENDTTNDMKIKFETLRSLDHKVTLDMDSHMNQLTHNPITKLESHSSILITSELLGLIPGEHDMSNEGAPLNDDCSELSGDGIHNMGGLMGQHGLGSGPKTWSQQDMENALDALRNHNMSLTKASSTFGIPSTTLWQRAHRLGIDTPKKEGPSKSWSEGNLHSALQALRTGTISANKASKAYGIPSSTLYKIARREGIRLAAPFNAAPTAWRPGDLERALHSIRSGHSSVQRASTEFGIPTGTLYGRCKREGIELSRSNPTPWSEDAMGEALEAVRIGQMSINQAAIHYNLPYSSLYGRFKRCKYEGEIISGVESSLQPHVSHDHLTNHQIIQQPVVGPHNHMLDHSMQQESQRHLYSVYHHPLAMQLPIHDHSEPNNVPHNNQDCIPIS